MIINAPYSKKRTNALVDKFFELLQKGVNTEEILFLVQNSRKKRELTEIIKKRFNLGSIGVLNIHSFFGLCYNLSRIPL